jgi:biopolymer transport protein ExbB
MKLRQLLLGGLFAVALPFTAQAEPVDLDQLLNLVQEGQARDNTEFEKRLAEFNSSKSRQEQLLADARADRERLEILSAEKESLFRENELNIAEISLFLVWPLAMLLAVWGVLQQVAALGNLRICLGVLLFPRPLRDEFLTDLIRVAGATSELPSIEQLERLWFEMQREATLSGRISSYTADVVAPSGETSERSVVRIGGFNAVADSAYLSWDIESARLVELDKQPGSRYTSSINDLTSASGDTLTGFWIDPSRGQLLKIMGQSPELGDRVDQGGVVGYIILVLGAIGILLPCHLMPMLSH